MLQTSAKMIEKSHFRPAILVTCDQSSHHSMTPLLFLRCAAVVVRFLKSPKAVFRNRFSLLIFNLGSKHTGTDFDPQQLLATCNRPPTSLPQVHRTVSSRHQLSPPPPEPAELAAPRAVCRVATCAMDEERH